MEIAGAGAGGAGLIVTWRFLTWLAFTQTSLVSS